jgi:hypothetical protein
VGVGKESLVENKKKRVGREKEKLKNFGKQRRERWCPSYG